MARAERPDERTRINRDRLLFWDTDLQAISGRFILRRSKRRYQNHLIGEPSPNQDTAEPPAIPADFAETDPSPAGTADALTGRAEEEGTVDEMMKPVERLLAEAATLEEFRDGLFALYAEMDATEFAGVLQRALLTAELAGRFEVNEEAIDAE